jgi:hypothetical protein
MARKRTVDKATTDGEAEDEVVRPGMGAPQIYKPTARECALLLLHLMSEKEEEERKREVGGKKGITRLRISELSLKRLWSRRRILPEFAEEVADWLAGAGVTLFFAGSTYAVVRTVVVEGWPRATSKRLKADMEAVAQGSFDFTKLEHLLAGVDQSGDEDHA